MVKTKKEKIIEKAEKEGFAFSKQALNMLEQLENCEAEADKLIALAKERKTIIAGGDVIKFIIRKQLPTSIVNRGE